MKKIASYAFIMFIIAQVLIASNSGNSSQIIEPPTGFNPLLWNWNLILVVSTIVLLTGICLRVFQIQRIVKK